MTNMVVIFTKNNARILRNPENLENYRSMKNAVVNPDLKQVEKIPPHLWKLENNKIVPISGIGVHIRKLHADVHGTVNDTQPLSSLVPSLKRCIKPILFILIGMLIMRLVL